jgi:ribosomal protein S18 acetylase RimI-like enzyme
MNLVITQISGHDISAVIELWNKELPIDSINKNLFISRVLLDEHFKKENVLIAKVKETNGYEIVGFIVGSTVNEAIYKDVDPDNIRCWITAMAVSKKHQNMGVGKMLLNALLKQFIASGKKECFIATYPYGYFVPGLDVKVYSSGIKFFEHFGFKENNRPLSMDVNIVLLDLGEGFEQKVDKLKKDGIEVVSYADEYILSYIDFMKSMTYDWYRVARQNLINLSHNTFFRDQITIAIYQNEVVGYCQFEGSHFGPFGVSEKYQGKGIGTILLGETLKKMRMYGYHDAWVLWTDDIAAKVYSKFGFKETRRFVTLKKEL